MAEFQVAEHSAEKVGPQPTVGLNAPYERSKRGRTIKIGGRINYEYPDSAVMLSKRGDKEDHSNARVKGSRDYTPPGSQISTGPSRGVSAGSFGLEGTLTR